MIEREYQELVGKNVRVIDGLVNRPAIVTGCDFHIGLTIIDSEDHDFFHCCLRGPLSPAAQEYVKRGGRFDSEGYSSVFDLHVQGIQSGVVDIDYIKVHCKGRQRPTPGATQKHCPFGQ